MTFDQLLEAAKDVKKSLQAETRYGYRAAVGVESGEIVETVRVQ